MRNNIIECFKKNEFYDLTTNDEEIMEITSLGYKVDCIGIDEQFYGDRRLVYIISHNGKEKEFYVLETKEVQERFITNRNGNIVLNKNYNME